MTLICLLRYNNCETRIKHIFHSLSYKIKSDCFYDIYNAPFCVFLQREVNIATNMPYTDEDFYLLQFYVAF